MVTCVDDVIEELTPITTKPDSVATSETAPAKGKVITDQAAGGAALVAAGRAVAPRPPKPLQPPLPEVKLSIEEALVLRQVPAAGATLDAVARAAQLPVAKTNALLVALRLKGRVRFLPGNRVASR